MWAGGGGGHFFVFVVYFVVVFSFYFRQYDAADPHQGIFQIFVSVKSNAHLASEWVPHACTNPPNEKCFANEEI